PPPQDRRYAGSSKIGRLGREKEKFNRKQGLQLEHKRQVNMRKTRLDESSSLVTFFNIRLFDAVVDWKYLSPSG
uniref:hypothetical protein n=1 Tax=Streptococcus sobrinus TaxID=1310 RepID=UPI0005172B1C